MDMGIDVCTDMSMDMNNGYWYGTDVGSIMDMGVKLYHQEKNKK